MKNWFGLESHPTDRFIHWSTKDEDIIKISEKLRIAYDKIVNGGLEKELKIIIDYAWQQGMNDCEDSHSEDL